MSLANLRSAFLFAPILVGFAVAPSAAQDATSGSASPSTAAGSDAQSSGSASGRVSLPLSESVRQTSIQQLQKITYDLIALHANVHQAHWNVQGIEFYQLHIFYKGLYEALEEDIDDSAERKLALGDWADGRLKPAAEATDIEPIPAGYMSDQQTLRFLAGNYSTMSKALYSAIDATGDDLVTQDLLIGFAHVIDKHFWQIRAHLSDGLDGGSQADGSQPGQMGNAPAGSGSQN